MSETAFVPEGLQKQREWLAAQSNQLMPCWACGVPTSQLAASDPEAYDPHSTANLFACPACDVPMKASMPLVAVGPVSWYWSRPANLIVTATEWRL